MSRATDTIDRVRSDARALHEKIAEASAKNEAMVRKELHESADKAQQLASQLRTMANEQQSDVAARFANAAASLESAAASSKQTAHARADQLREQNKAMLSYVQSALKNISSGIAAERSAKKPAEKVPTR